MALYGITCRNQKKIAVIGGGIGGMEAATVCAKRGHKVTLYEKSDKLGGVFIAAAAPSFKEKDRALIAWYIRELSKYPIEIKMNTEIKDVTALDAEEVIVATGAVANKIPVKGAENAVEAIDYLLGTNPNGECYFTGYGTVSPENPHHRPSMAVGKAMKGMLVGGVNSNLEDSAAKAYCQDLPAAKRYVDNSESYSTNEITIYWNSPLTYLISLTDNAEHGDYKFILGDVNCDGYVDCFDMASARTGLVKGSFNDDNSSKAADVNQDGKFDVSDAVLLSQYIIGKIKTFPKADTPVTPTEPSNPSKINDYGTPMNENASVIADFRKGQTPVFFASDGWTNGSCFDCGWYKKNTSFDDGVLNLTIDKDNSGKYNYSAAEYRTTDFYHYGYYETSMQAIKNDGVVSSFFTYTGPSDNNPWDEIDIEVLGKDTTKVQLNYYTNGVGNHEYMYDLGFDASEGFHTYGFDWQADHITWYVDGKAVYTAYNNIPSTPGKIMMNVWPGTGVDEWLKPFNGNTPLTARYQWVTYNK